VQSWLEQFSNYINLNIEFSDLSAVLGASENRTEPYVGIRWGRLGAQQQRNASNV